MHSFLIILRIYEWCARKPVPIISKPVIPTSYICTENQFTGKQIYSLVIFVQKSSLQNLQNVKIEEKKIF